MSVKVTVERTDDKPGISLKDGDVCLLRCGGVVMVERNGDGAYPYWVGDDCAMYREDGTYAEEDYEHPLDITEVLGSGADFLKRVEAVVKVRGE